MGTLKAFSINHGTKDIADEIERACGYSEITISAGLLRIAFELGRARTLFDAMSAPINADPIEDAEAIENAWQAFLVHYNGPLEALRDRLSAVQSKGAVPDARHGAGAGQVDAPPLVKRLIADSLITGDYRAMIGLPQIISALMEYQDYHHMPDKEIRLWIKKRDGSDYSLSAIKHARPV